MFWWILIVLMLFVGVGVAWTFRTQYGSNEWTLKCIWTNMIVEQSMLEKEYVILELQLWSHNMGPKMMPIKIWFCKNIIPWPFFFFFCWRLNNNYMGIDKYFNKTFVIHLKNIFAFYFWGERNWWPHTHFFYKQIPFYLISIMF